MNLDTDRRTNAVFVARSRSHRLVLAASRILRATDMTLRIADCGLRTADWQLGIQSAIRNPQSELSVSQNTFDQTAVNLHGRPGDVRRGIGQQERRGASEIVGLPVSADRNACKRARLHL